jgi:hypothetical protein
LRLLQSVSSLSVGLGNRVFRAEEEIAKNPA